MAAGAFTAFAALNATASRGTDHADEWGCGVARPTVSPSPVTRGQAITVTAGSAHCAKSLPAGTTFDVSVSPSDGSDARESEQASVHHDGSFTVTLTIPGDFPIGEAVVWVDDTAYVPCHDTGAGTLDGMALVSCAASETEFEVAG
ncbi:hypothetical protein [Gryllotalpicola daejeonensis]|uniref:hypothetical protein n=1 Tax=Gryllotalpicola daejeonensis TaxID=993087 RepID=UPI0031D769F8